MTSSRVAAALMAWSVACSFSSKGVDVVSARVVEVGTLVRVSDVRPPPGRTNHPSLWLDVPLPPGVTGKWSKADEAKLPPTGPGFRFRLIDSAGKTVAEQSGTIAAGMPGVSSYQPLIDGGRGVVRLATSQKFETPPDGAPFTVELLVTPEADSKTPEVHFQMYAD